MLILNMISIWILAFRDVLFECDERGEDKDIKKQTSEALTVQTQTVVNGSLSPFLNTLDSKVAINFPSWLVTSIW